MTDKKLVVIAGPANSGKMPLARKLAAEDPTLKIVHRDDLRAMFVNPVLESTITRIMAEVASELLANSHSPLVVAWNLEVSDRVLWGHLSHTWRVPLEWLDVREPEVAAMIPPLRAPPPQADEGGTGRLRGALQDIASERGRCSKCGIPAEMPSNCVSCDDFGSCTWAPIDAVEVARAALAVERDR